VTGEEKIAEEPRPGRLVENGEVGVGVGRRPSLDHEPPAAEVEIEPVRDEPGRRDEAGSPDRILAEEVARRSEVARPARGERLGEVAVADEGGALPREGRVAEEVVGVDVGVDDVADRQPGLGAHRRQKPSAGRLAALGVDDGDGVAADHEAGIGDGSFVRGAGEGDRRGVDEGGG
jgi:hypothetical protein